jgi:hypothetical protein
VSYPTRPRSGVRAQNVWRRDEALPVVVVVVGDVDGLVDDEHPAPTTKTLAATAVTPTRQRLTCP